MLPNLKSYTNFTNASVYLPSAIADTNTRLQTQPVPRLSNLCYKNHNFNRLVIRQGEKTFLKVIHFSETNQVKKKVDLQKQRILKVAFTSNRTRLDGNGRFPQSDRDGQNLSGNIPRNITLQKKKKKGTAKVQTIWRLPGSQCGNLFLLPVHR